MLNVDSNSSLSAGSIVVTNVYAGFWRRFAALMIDAIISLAFGFVGGLVIPVVGPFLLAALYFPVFLSSSMRATPGKAIMGVQVQTESGETLSLAQAFGRWFLSYLSGACFLIGYLIQPFTEKRQTFHDLVIQSVVVRKEQPQGTNYLDIWIEQIRRIFSGESKLTSTSTGTTIVNQTSSAEAKESKEHKDPAAIEKLEKLHNLLKEGVLTEEEFNQKKAEILKNI